MRDITKARVVSWRLAVGLSAAIVLGNLVALSMKDSEEARLWMDENYMAVAAVLFVLVIPMFALWILQLYVAWRDPALSERARTIRLLVLIAFNIPASILLGIWDYLKRSAVPGRLPRRRGDEAPT